ncbi:hypothetical protein [Qipengyuania spongiae]|uniref:hypothetical protein n=1 Tax=Qipengyuania spongiae TaxID=2909673 RepID=UPI003B977C68
MDRLGGTFGSYDHADDHDDYDDSDHGDDLGAPQSPVGQDERRMQVRAYNHWASLLGNRNFPAISGLDLERLDDFAPSSVLLDFTDGVEDPRVCFLGAELAAECDAGGRIVRLSDVPSRSLLSRITDHYMQILANQAPIGFEAEFLNQRDQTVLYRGILLPYSSNDTTIDFIYGVINWKKLADSEMADELLLEIDRELENGAIGAAANDEPVLELSAAWMEVVEDPGHEASAPIDWNAAGSPLRRRGDDPAFANPIDGQDRDEWEWSAEEDDMSDYSVDYGENGLEDEGDGGDVDEVVNPLADESVGSGLAALVTRGQRRPLLIDPAQCAEQSESPEDRGPAIPQAYEPEDNGIVFVPAPIEAPLASRDAGGAAQDAVEEPAEAPRNETETRDEQDEVSREGEADDVEPSPGFAEEPDIREEGLHDTLAAARELAQHAQATDDRTRVALYRAVGRAYDVSIAAALDPEGFAEIIADNGLSVQARAPMTPIVKLVFGSDYDKTRITEYAAVLAHARRLDIARGGLAPFLTNVEGGLKSVVEAERSARREEAGKPARSSQGIKPGLVKKLRKLEPVDLTALDSTGPEFTLVMVRREQDGGIVLLGEVPQATRLVERAARTLVG